MNRTKRAVATLVTSSIATLVTILGGFIVTPVVLHLLGDETFGAFRVGLDVYGYLSLLDLGLAAALLPLLARELAQDQPGGVERTVAAAAHAYAGVCLVTLLVGGALGFFVTSLIPVSAERVTDLREGWCVLVAGSLLLPLAPFRPLAESRQRGYLVNAALIPQYLVAATSAVALAYLGAGILGQCIAHVLGIATFHVLLLVVGLLAFPGIASASLKRTPPEARSQLLELSVPMFVFGLCSRASYMSDNVIAGAVLGPTTVAPLVMTQRLGSLVQGQLQNIGNSTWAALAEMHGRGERDAFNARLIELTRLVGIVGTVFLTPIVAYNHAFVRQWVGETHYANDAVTLVSVSNAYVLSLQSLWLWCFNGTGHVRVALPVQIASTILNVALSVFLTGKIGVVGPSLGTLLAVSVTLLLYLPRLMRPIFGTNPRTLLRAALEPVLWTAPFTTLVWFFAHSRHPTSFATLLAEMGAVGAAHGLLSWFLVLRSAERASLRLRLGI